MRPPILAVTARLLPFDDSVAELYCAFLNTFSRCVCAVAVAVVMNPQDLQDRRHLLQLAGAYAGWSLPRGACNEERASGVRVRLDR